MNFLKIIFLTFWVAISISDMSGQMPDAVANFVVPAEIKTLPEHPSFCRSDIGVMVTVDGDFADDDIIWDHVKTGTILKGKSQTLKHAGIWKITVKYNLNGATCEKTKAINVSDLNDPFQIQTYFSQAGFWPITIFRDPEEAPQCRGCGCEGDLEKVSFQQELSLGISLLDDFENFQSFRPFQGMEYTKKISNNACLCNDDGSSNISDFEATLADGDLSLWGHQFFENEDTREGKLYVKASMSWQQSSPVGAHKNRLNKIVDDIISQNPGTTNQARVLFTNLFMTNPIGGYDFVGECADPKECYAQGNFLTPTGTHIKLPEGATSFIFAPSVFDEAVFEGALLGYNNSILRSVRAYRYQGLKFAGYFEELSGEIVDDFVSEQPNLAQTGLKAFLPIVCEGECKTLRIPINNISNTTETDGGIKLALKSSQTHDLFGGCLSNANRNRGGRNTGTEVTFMTPTSGLITLKVKNINTLSFVYQSYESSNVEEITSGMLWSFEFVLDPESGCGYTTYTYDTGSKAYEDELGNPYIDLTDNSEIMSVNYMMNCAGSYNIYNIEKGRLNKHINGVGTNYHESFTKLTEFFVPFSDEFSLTVGGSAALTQVSSLPCSFCPDQETGIRIIRQPDYCFGPEHIFVEKIAQLATVYPSYFTDPEYSTSGTYTLNNCGGEEYFTQSVKWEKPVDFTYSIEQQDGSITITINKEKWIWGKFLQENPAVLQYSKVNFFKTFIAQFLSKKQEQKNWWNSIGQKSRYDIVCHLRDEPQSITNSIEWAKKQVALNTIYQEAGSGNIWNDAEYAVIHILASSTPNEVMEHVYSKGMQYFWENFHDFAGDENLTRLVHVICSKSILSEYNEYTDMGYFYENPENLHKLEADLWSLKNLNFTITENSVYLYNNNFGATYDFYDVLPIEIAGKFKVGNDEFKDGLIIHVPAIQAVLYAHKNDVAIQERGAWVAVDLGLTAFGVGAYKYIWKGASLLRKGFIAAEITGSVLGLSSQLIDGLDDDVRAKIQMAAFVLVAPEVGISLVEAVAGTRLLRNAAPTNPNAIDAANQIRLAHAEKDLKDFPEALAFVRTDPRGADAWEGLLSSEYLRKNKSALIEAEYLLWKGFSNSNLNSFASYVENVFPTTKSTLISRISNGSGFNLIHTDDEIRVIMLRAKSLNLDNDIIDDFLIISCRTLKPIPAQELLEQMNNWVNVVKPRGYPYRFNNLSEYQQFGNRLKIKLTEINVSNLDVRVQGSALRKPNAEDVDLATIIDQSEFDNIIKIGYSNRITKNSIPVNMSNMSHQELIDLSNDIFTNPNLYNAIGRNDFNYNFPSKIINASPDKGVVSGIRNLLTEIQAEFPNLNIKNITIQESGSVFDLKPYLNL